MDILKEKAYKWLITINNPDDKGIAFEDLPKIIDSKWKKVIYYCYCKEIGNETHTPHFHIFLYTQNQIHGSSVSKAFKNAHVDLCRGTCQENRDYIYKTGKWENDPKEDTRIEGMQYESGECPEEKPGKRTDLDELRKLILEGKTNGEIYEINSAYQRFANTIDKIRLDLLTDKWGDKWRQIEVTYICGHTGTGKTRGVLEEYGYRNVCRIKRDDYAFSNYTSEDVLMFEEFRNTFKLQDMLDYLDGYPTTGRAMHGFRQLAYTKVFICSNWQLEEQYQDIQEKHPLDWQAFLRRINKIVIYTESGRYEYFQKNIGTAHAPRYDYFTEDGTSYFDPFGKNQPAQDNPNVEDAVRGFETLDMNIKSWDDLP